MVTPFYKLKLNFVDSCRMVSFFVDLHAINIPTLKESGYMIFLKERDVVFLADTDSFCIPDARLHLSDMRTAHHEHAKTGLTYTTADGKGKLVV